VNVFVTMPDGEEITFGYSPDHYAGVHAYYTEQKQRGKIKSFRIER
jgi:hypothetical protein